MTTFAKGRRVRHLPLPRHEHIGPVEVMIAEDLRDEPPEVTAALRAFVGAIARMHARQHHAAEFGSDE